MKCEEIRELIAPYSSGDLDNADNFQVKTHLEECEHCALFSDQSEQVWSLLDKWEEIEPDGDYLARFWSSVSAEDEKRKTGMFDFIKSLRSKWAVSGALVTVIVIAGLLFGLFGPDQADVVFTERDMQDEQILIKMNEAVSRETAESLEIYGPWDEKIEQSIKGG